jgi:hypothetical protein
MISIDGFMDELEKIAVSPAWVTKGFGNASQALQTARQSSTTPQSGALLSGMRKRLEAGSSRASATIAGRNARADQLAGSAAAGKVNKAGQAVRDRSANLSASARAYQAGRQRLGVLTMPVGNP